MRLGEEQGEGDSPLSVETAAGVLRIERTRGVQNSFLIDSGNGEAVLFLTLLDGVAVNLRAGAERMGQVWLRWGR
ncbi:MAG: hypothetical protein KatS3mg022_3507 [Armatimonadota bacterium]|nr:MAG: hypothetical protein KatS3mg022_3507 [Armatimonadota bacterium]